VKEFIEAFKALRHAPRALWMVIFAFSLDAMAYFGILPLMKAYLGTDIGIRPEYASTWVSIFTGALTLVMLFVGKPVEDRFGIRKGLLLSLGFTIVGRAVYGFAPFAGGWVAILVSLVIVALGEGIMQPVAYAGVKRYTDAKNGAMGYAMLYAVMNLAIVGTGPMSSYVRTTYDAKHKAGASALTGFNAVNWTCFGITVLTALVFILFMTKKAEANIVRNTEAPKPTGDEPKKKTKSPFSDPRFLFFIFMLLPVRTLFAHQWLTMPEYVLRAYDHSVADKMEWLVDSLNPIIIFVGVPTLTALTRRFHVYSMMIIGTLVSASATFLLCTGPHVSMLIAYFFVFSIGEALWSSRFLEYAAELAPEGRVAQYMGVANLPWFVAKMTTGFYSGFILEKFCPAVGLKRTEMMWLIYGIIAMASPVGLVMARKWVMKGMSASGKTQPA
jgi:MFS family permease